jgi:hypothetical protein
MSADLGKQGINLPVHILGVLTLDQELTREVLEGVIELSNAASEHL